MDEEEQRLASHEDVNDDLVFDSMSLPASLPCSLPGTPINRRSLESETSVSPEVILLFNPSLPELFLQNSRFFIMHPFFLPMMIFEYIS